MAGATEIKYRLPWRATSWYPGGHPGMQRGSGFEIHALAPLYAAGDPRRLDLKASLRDPFGQLCVRVYKQRGTVPVIVLADVSASMSFVGNTSKLDLLIDFVASLAHSTDLIGDPFAFTACDSIVRRELSVPLTRVRGAGALVSRRLRDWAPDGVDAGGLLAGAEQIPGARALVFLVSDFHLPLDLLRALLNCLSAHAVVPVVIQDSAEGRVPGFGITRLHDPETGSARTVFLRPSLARRLRREMQTRDAALRACLADHDVRPLYLLDRFDPEAVTRYFHG